MILHEIAWNTMKHTHTHIHTHTLENKISSASSNTNQFGFSFQVEKSDGLGLDFHCIFSETRKEASWQCATTTYALQQPTDFMFGTHWPQSLKIVSESEIRSILDNKRKLYELWTVLGLASYIRFNEAFAIKHRNTPNISFQYVNVVGILGLILASLSTITVNSHVRIYLIYMYVLFE